MGEFPPDYTSGVGKCNTRTATYVTWEPAVMCFYNYGCPM